MKKNAKPTIFPPVSNALANNTTNSENSVRNTHASKREEENHSTAVTAADISSQVKAVKLAHGAKNQFNVLPSACEDVMPVKCCDSAELHEILKAEYANLQLEYYELETKRCVELAKYENDLKMWRSKAEARKQEVKFLSLKISKLEKSEKSLKTLVETLKELKEQKMLSADAFNALEVNFLVFECAHNGGIECAHNSET